MRDKGPVSRDAAARRRSSRRLDRDDFVMQFLWSGDHLSSGHDAATRVLHMRTLVSVDLDFLHEPADQPDPGALLGLRRLTQLLERLLHVLHMLAVIGVGTRRHLHVGSVSSRARMGSLYSCMPTSHRRPVRAFQGLTLFRYQTPNRPPSRTRFLTLSSERAGSNCRTYGQPRLANSGAHSPDQQPEPNEDSEQADEGTEGDDDSHAYIIALA